MKTIIQKRVLLEETSTVEYVKELLELWYKFKKKQYPLITFGSPEFSLNEGNIAAMSVEIEGDKDFILNNMMV